MAEDSNPWRALPEGRAPESVDAAEARIVEFAADLEFIPEGGDTLDLETKVREFAMTFSSSLTEHEQEELGKYFGMALPLDFYPVDGTGWALNLRQLLLTTFYSNLRATDDLPDFDSESRALVHDSAKYQLADLMHLNDIQDEIERLAAQLPRFGLPLFTEGRLVSELKWHLRGHPHRRVIATLFRAYVYDHPNEQDLRHPEISSAMYERLYLKRPDLLTINDTFGPILFQRLSLSSWFKLEVHATVERTLPPLPELPSSQFTESVKRLNTRFSEVSQLGQFLSLISMKIFYILGEYEPTSSDDEKARTLAENALKQAGSGLWDLKLFQPPSAENPEELENKYRQEFVRHKEILQSVRNSIVVAEEYAISKETAALATRSVLARFEAIASRFERAKLRYAFLQYIDEKPSADDKSDEESLKRIDYKQDLLRSYPNPDTLSEACSQPIDPDDTKCPICTDSFHEKQDEIATAAVVVSHQCCKRPFHVDCLLEWMFSQVMADKIATCPMCRAQCTASFAGDVMEKKTLMMGVL